MIKYPMIFHDGQAPSILHYIFQQHSLELTANAPENIGHLTRKRKNSKPLTHQECKKPLKIEG